MEYTEEFIQKVVDRINASIEYYPFMDNLEEIEVYTNTKDNKQDLFVYWSGFVTVNMINAINEELGTDMNYIFHEGNRLNTIIKLNEVIER